jgi:hypothetical protein
MPPVESDAIDLAGAGERSIFAEDFGCSVFHVSILGARPDSFGMELFEE